MSGFPILDLILGLTFIFFVLSIISSAVVETFLTKRDTRSKVLTKWLVTIFDKPYMQPDGKTVKLGSAIADHCLTTALSDVGLSTSFIDAKNFVSALIEKLTFDINEPGKTITSLEQLLENIRDAKAIDGTSLLSTELMRTLLLFGNEAKLLAPATLVAEGGQSIIPNTDGKNSLQLFREKIELWFDSSMDRITGELKKKHTRPLTFWVGVVVVILLNVDTIQIASYLYSHQEEAKQFADRATISAQYIEHTSKDTTIDKSKVIAAAIDSLQKTVPKELPMGWSEVKENTVKAYLTAAQKHAFGWLATVMAIMLGAPFWFDLLNKIGNVRGSGAKPAPTDPGKKPATGTTS